MAESRAARLRLDEVDRKLLYDLRQDGRVTYAELAGRVGLSHAATRARVHRLLRAGIVRIAAIPDPSVLGMGSNGMVEIEAGDAAKEVGGRVSAIPETSFVAVAAGRIDVMAEVRCRTDDHLLECFDRIRGLRGVRRLKTYKYLAIVQDAYRPSEPAEPIELDAVDRSLVVALQEDGRAPYVALSKTVGLSEAATRVRVQRLLGARAVTVVGLIDPMGLQMGEMAGFGLSADGPALEVATAVARVPSIIFVAATSGRHDVLGTAIGSSDVDILRTMDTIRRHSGVRALESNAILAIVKEQYRSTITRDGALALKTTG